ncbi:unnamed protein product [Caenorhabditis bovis]|uniref:Uncharacterized protein n=1 Tax=Caenorhabditis bovis TaxID=2654633 RepID=A0A8S1EPS7_9PELO|nr:unnamed protein product [Caenorhabditis bovis]
MGCCPSKPVQARKQNRPPVTQNTQKPANYQQTRRPPTPPPPYSPTPSPKIPAKASSETNVDIELTPDVTQKSQSTKASLTTFTPPQPVISPAQNYQQQCYQQRCYQYPQTVIQSPVVMQTPIMAPPPVIMAPYPYWYDAMYYDPFYCGFYGGYGYDGFYW